MKIFWSTFFFFLFNFFTSGKACAQDRRPEKLSQRFEKTLKRTATQEPPIKSSLNNFRQLRNLLSREDVGDFPNAVHARVDELDAVMPVFVGHDIHGWCRGQGRVFCF